MSARLMVLSNDLVIHPPIDVERAALERRWLDWSATFLSEGDVPGAVNALQHAAVALASHDAIHARCTRPTLRVAA